MTTRLIDGMRRYAHPLTRAAADYDPLVELVGEARFVLLGEASYGTHESSIGNGLKSPNGLSLRKRSPPWLSRPIGRTRTTSPGTCGVLVMGRAP